MSDYQEQQQVNITCVEHIHHAHIPGYGVGAGMWHLVYWCGDERISFIEIKTPFGTRWETCKELGPSDDEGDQIFGSREEGERMILRHFAMKYSVPVADIKVNRVKVAKNCAQIKCNEKPAGDFKNGK